MKSTKRTILLALLFFLPVLAYGESTLQEMETSYEILRRSKREQRLKEGQEAFSLGPVVAKARLRFMPNKGVSPVGYLGSQR